MPVGSGRKADACWVVILCPTHHPEAHTGEKTLAAKHNLDLPREAQEHWGEWMALCLEEDLARAAPR